MKRLLITLTILAFITITAGAQDYRTAIGLRGGYPANGVTIKHFLNTSNAVEGILATSHGGFVVTALYENEHWTGEYPGLNWFWGFGAHIGFWDSNPYIDNVDVSTVLGADFILGLEYTFDEIPLNLSIDLLPSVNLLGYSGWGGIHGGLSIRYAF
ncbi:MAG: hypothetical protein K8R35_01545 [Bacteroidales bacterium]|nr:hypothetical protein [Bacteroidales bacterium]